MPEITNTMNNRGLIRYGVKCPNCGKSYVGGLSPEDATEMWSNLLSIDRRIWNNQIR